LSNNLRSDVDSLASCISEIVILATQKRPEYSNSGHIGATPPGYNLAMQIQPNDQLGIQFKGFFDHRDLNRLSHEFTGRITGNVEQVIALAFLYFFMLISMWFNIF
jgi:hypothetical protein